MVTSQSREYPTFFDIVDHNCWYIDYKLANKADKAKKLVYEIGNCTAYIFLIVELCKLPND